MILAGVETRQVACDGCGRPLVVPKMWATSPGRDRMRGGNVRRVIVCHDRHYPGRGCYDPRRHVRWAGTDDDLWALVTKATP